MNNRRISIEKTIAVGGHSKVQLGRDLDTFEPLAIKRIALDTNGRLVFEAELEVLSRLPTHRNIPKFHGSSSTDSRGYIVMEYLPFPSLKKMIEENGPLSEENALNILKQIIDVISFMAENGVCHRDLKSENIIVNPDTFVIKIIDFGLATTAIKSAETRDDQPIGTPVYMAPAVLTCADTGRPFRVLASDLWSAGMIFWECLLGEHPFNCITNKKDLIAAQVTARAFDRFGPTSQHLLEGLLTVEETHRMTASDARSFIRHHDKARKSLCESSGTSSESSTKRSRSNSYCMARRKSSSDLSSMVTC